MLQFIAEENKNYTIPELVQMAIEGGCKWVHLHAPQLSDSDLRALALELVPLCKESATILTIEDHMVMAKELGIHGILLVDTQVTAHEAREFCGPEAIIGVQVQKALDVVPLRDLDVDYVTFPPDTSIDSLSHNIEAIRSADIILPVVAVGNYSADQIPALLQAGVSGIALSAAIANAADPVEATRSILTALTTDL